MLLETDQPEEALDRVQKALSIEPLSNDGLRLLGRAQAELGHVDDAVAASQRALAIDDTYLWAMNNLGYLYIQHGRSVSACRRWRGRSRFAATSRSSRQPRHRVEGSGHLSEAKTAYEGALHGGQHVREGVGGPGAGHRAGGGTDTVSVDLAGLSKQFQDEIEQWRTAVVPTDSMATDSALTDSVTADSATTDSAQGMVRDSVSQ